jgi:group I intron endonuclease
MTYTVYEARNLINNKLYIGITGRPLAVRKRRHFHASASGRGAIFGAAIRRYGKDNFNFRPLLVCPDLSYANYAERALIALYKPEYNLTAGGDGVLGFKLSDEAKKKIGETHKGCKHWLGRKHKEETKAKMSAARTAYWASKEHSRKKYQRKEGPRRGRVIVCKGIIYENLSYAAKANGISRDRLHSVMRRKKNPGLIDGLKFNFVEFSI